MIYQVKHVAGTTFLSINQITFTGNVKFRFTAMAMSLYCRIHLSFPIDFRDKLWAGIGLGVRIGLRLCF